MTASLAWKNRLSIDSFCGWELESEKPGDRMIGEKALFPLSLTTLFGLLVLFTPLDMLNPPLCPLPVLAGLDEATVDRTLGALGV